MKVRNRHGPAFRVRKYMELMHPFCDIPPSDDGGFFVPGGYITFDSVDNISRLAYAYVLYRHRLALVLLRKGWVRPAIYGSCRAHSPAVRAYWALHNRETHLRNHLAQLYFRLKKEFPFS